MRVLRANKSRQVTIRRQWNRIIMAGGNFSDQLKEQRALVGVASHRFRPRSKYPNAARQCIFLGFTARGMWQLCDSYLFYLVESQSVKLPKSENHIAAI